MADPNKDKDKGGTGNGPQTPPPDAQPAPVTAEPRRLNARQQSGRPFTGTTYGVQFDDQGNSIDPVDAETAVRLRADFPGVTFSEIA